MSISLDFDAAARAGIITSDQAKRLAEFFATTALAIAPAAAAMAAPPADGAAPRPKFDLAHLLWYAGALIIILAMGLFTTLAFAQLGGGALLVCALIYAAAGVGLGNMLWRKGLTTPGGLLVAVAVSMTPLAVFGFQDAMGAWGTFGDPGNYRDYYHFIKGSFLPMELATLVAALVAIRFFPFGFTAMIAAVALWFMSMDLAPWFSEGRMNFETQRQVSIWFGLIVMLAAWIVDLKQTRADYAFWLHFAGILAFWGGLYASPGSTEAAKFVFFLFNVGLLGFAAFMNRRIYAVFGAIGVATYVGYLAYRVFMDSLLFPFILSGLGLGVIALGLLYHRNSARIEEAMKRSLPEGLLALRPAHAR